MEKFRENVLVYGSLLVVLLTPIVYFNSLVFPHITSKTFFLYGSIEILAAVWVYSCIVDPTYRLSKKTTLFFLPVIAFGVWMTIAGILALDPTLSFWSTFGRGTGLITFYHTVVFGFIVASLIRREGNSFRYRLMRWAVTGAFFLGLTIWVGNEGFNLGLHFLRGKGGGGLMGNSSLAAAYLIFMLCFAAILLSSTKKHRWWNIVAVAVIMFSPIFIDIHGFFLGKGILGSARGAFLGICIAIGVSVLVYNFFSKKVWLRIGTGLLMVAGIAVFILGWVRLVTPGTYLHEKFIQSASATRFIFWDVAKDALHDHPWFGYGPENYMMAFQTHFPPEVLRKENNLESANDRAHNVFYDTGAAAGYPAVVLYSILLLGIYYGIYRGYRNGYLSRIQAAIYIGTLTGYIFQNLFIFDSPGSLTALFVFMGLIYGMQDSVQSEKNNNGISRVSSTARFVLGLVFVVVTIIVFINIVWRPVAKAKKFASVFGSAVNLRAARYEELLHGSSIGNDWDVGGFAHDVYKLYASDPVGVKNNVQLMKYVPADLTSLLSYLNVIAKNYPLDYRLYISIVHLYSTKIYFTDQLSDPETTKYIIGVINHAKELSPTNPESYWGMAQVDVWKGDLKGAEQEYRTAIALDPQLPASHRLFIKFAEAVGNKKLYAEAFTEANKDVPNFELNQCLINCNPD